MRIARIPDYWMPDWALVLVPLLAPVLVQGAVLAPVLLSTRRWHVNEVRTADLDAFIRQHPHESVKLMKMDLS